MNNTFYFLRHGQTKRDGSVPISKWVLSDEGEKQAKRLAQADVFNDVEVIISSTEEKAYRTAKPIADKLGLDIIQVEEIAELNRDKGRFMKPEEYEKTIKQCLENLDESFNNWESAAHALERFEKKIRDLDRAYENKKILVVGHGFTINLYFAKLLGILKKTYERLGTNGFADWGIIKNQSVIKDISK